MWILSSLGRADRIKELVRSYIWGEDKVVLALFRGDTQLHKYMDETWPRGWTTEIVEMRGNGPTYNEILRRYPEEKCYGFLADDATLDVQGMLALLEQAADDWNVAYANDKHHGEKIPTMPCIGGKLVRGLGYLAPHGLIHMAIDSAWYEIGRRMGTLRYFDELTYTHLNPVWGTAPDDRTYQLARWNSTDYERKFAIWAKHELDGDIERVKALKAAA